MLAGTGLGPGIGGAADAVIPVELGERALRRGGGRRCPAPPGRAWWPRRSRGAARAAVVTQAGIGVEVDPGVPFERFTVPDGEAAKSLAVVEDLCRGFARAGISRSDVVVAVGGGVVTDLAGFAAASFHRGTAYVNVATTLLAQVDAAVGGKTGVNLPEGKNLVGAFWQPRAVLCDTEVLATLPPREWASGRGRDGQVRLPGRRHRSRGRPRRLAARPAAGRAGGPVRGHQGRGGGLRRAGGRPTHAPQLRPHPGPRPRGRGVRSRRRLGPAARGGGGHRAWCSPASWPDGWVGSTTVGSELHRRVVGGFDLSPLLPHDADPERLVSFMARDKKARHDLTFVLDGPGGVEVVHGVDRADVVATLAAMDRTGAGRREHDRGPARSCCCPDPTSTCWASGSPRSTARPRLADHVATATAVATGLGYVRRAPPDQPRG